MPGSDSDAFLQHLKTVFRTEAAEHLQAMGTLLQGLAEAREPAAQAPLIETLFREVHSLKGAARSVGEGEMEAICTVLESRMAALKRGDAAWAASLVPAFQARFDELGDLLGAGAPVAALSPPVPPPPREAEPAPAASAAVEPAPAPAPAAVAATDTAVEARPAASVATAPLYDGALGESVRISTARLMALLVQVEALHAYRSNAGTLMEELRAMLADVSDWNRTTTQAVDEVRARRRQRARTDVAREADVEPLLGLVEHDGAFARTLEERLLALRRRVDRHGHALDSLSNRLREDMKLALMQPFAELLGLCTRLVRDLARDSGKDIAFVAEGAAIEVDRRVLEQIKDPLIHLLRNAVDHGIEPPEQRTRRGKPPRGRITIAITPYEGNQVELVLQDDGGGIPLDRVLGAARELGVLAPDAPAPPGEAVLDLVFASGLSTSPMLTDLSGRGLGLAIVREKIERLGGRITVEQPGAGGTLFRMRLPSTLTQFRGLQVTAGGQRFVLPSRNVVRALRMRPDMVRTLEGREVVEVEERAVALVRLSRVLGLADPPARPAEGTEPAWPAVLLFHGEHQLACLVDAVLGDREVTVKGLGPQLQRVRNVAGATLVEGGRLVPILSVPDLFASARALAAQPSVPGAAPVAAATPRRSLLVAEDSITSRTLLKGILEAAGYDVTTAVDGIDALTTLRSQHVDLVVSDVEMPRMDGFDLTARIRQDKQLAALPVVLVTALASREHRERGMDVGANAYIVKSSFDQGNLIDVVRRLT